MIRDGTIRYIESQGSVLRGADGAVSNVVVVSRDITARRAADRRLREQAALLDQANDAICATDLNQRITYWNKSAELLYGWSAQEALGRGITDLVFRGDLSILTSALKALFHQHGWQGELEQITKDKRGIVVDTAPR